MAEDDLLRPSLSGAGSTPALYHSSGFFLVAFFVGPAAAGAYGLANSHRLGRLRRDLPAILAVVAACYAVLMVAHRNDWLSALAAWLDDGQARAFQLATRALGLAGFAAIYLLHRQHYRAARVSGVDPLPGWVPGVAAAMIGIAANALMGLWIKAQN